MYCTAQSDGTALCSTLLHFTLTPVPYVYDAILYSTIYMYDTVDTVLYDCTLLVWLYYTGCTILHSWCPVLWSSTVLYVPYRTALHCNVPYMYYTALYCALLHCAVPCYTALHCAVPHCTMPYHSALMYWPYQGDGLDSIAFSIISGVSSGKQGKSMMSVQEQHSATNEGADDIYMYLQIYIYKEQHSMTNDVPRRGVQWTVCVCMWVCRYRRMTYDDTISHQDVMWGIML